MKSFKNLPKPLYVALLTAPVLLAGCTEITTSGPRARPMPTGYTYHHDEYKAPPGPQPVFKKWEYKNGVREEPQPMPMQLDGQSTGNVRKPRRLRRRSWRCVVGGGDSSWQQAADELNGVPHGRRFLASRPKPCGSEADNRRRPEQH